MIITVAIINAKTRTKMNVEWWKWDWVTLDEITAISRLEDPDPSLTHIWYALFYILITSKLQIQSNGALTKNFRPSCPKRIHSRTEVQDSFLLLLGSGLWLASLALVQLFLLRSGT